VKISKFVEEAENVSWLIDGLLPDVGWTLFYGTREVGKTTFAMQMCDSLQKGQPFLGRETKQCDILFIQADSLALEWKAMLKRIAPKSQGWTMLDVPSKCLGNPQYVDTLNNLKEKVSPGFIVFDSLYNLTAWPINTESVLIPVNMMKAIAGGVPWLLIHHPPHSETRAAGHHSLGSNCSNEWALLRNKLKIQKGRLVKDKEILLSRDDDGLWALKAEEEGSNIFNKPIF